MEKKGNALAWLALIVGILALILAWSAFNRSGADVDEVIDEVVEETDTTNDQGAAAADALDGDSTDTVEAEASTEVEG